MKRKDRELLSQLDLKTPLEKHLRYRHNFYIPETAQIDDLTPEVRDAYNKLMSDEAHAEKAAKKKTSSFGNADDIHDTKFDDRPHRKFTIEQSITTTYTTDFVTEKEIQENEIFEDIKHARRQKALKKALRMLKRKNPKCHEIVLVYYSIIGNKKTAYTGLGKFLNVTRQTAKKRYLNAMDELNKIINSIYKE
ncbi:MAG: hypothetical protein PUE12_01715 [Oscillospiraceae bacterium]|nr:hypothetical protein [Oscillospiraceae bacterium]